MRLLILVSFVLALDASIDRDITVLHAYHDDDDDDDDDDDSNSQDAITEVNRYDEIPVTQATHLSFNTGRDPHYAIDGDPLLYSEGRETQYDVYFKGVFSLAYVKKVIIYPAPDKSSKLKKYEVCIKYSANNVECQTLNKKASYQGTVLSFSGTSFGTEIYVVQKDDRQSTLPIGEVRVFGRLYLEQVPLYVPNMVGSSSHTADMGLTFNKWSHFQTGQSTDAWWEADLGSQRTIYRVFIYTYLPEASNLLTFKIILSKVPITDQTSRTDDSNTAVLNHALSASAPSGGVYPDPWAGFTARYIRIEMESIYTIPLSLTNVQVYALNNQGKHNQNWGFTTTGCAELQNDAEDLENHAVNCGTDTSGLLSGFAMREHSDCSGNEYKMESYCTNAKTGGSCSTRQTSCMNLKSGLESITQSVDCSSIGGIKDWQVVGSDCSSNQRRISYTCCPLDSSGVSRVESTPCVEVDGQPASDAFLLYRPHCLENEVMSKWEFVSDCSDSKFRRIAFTCLQVNTVTLPRVRAENIQLVTHETSSWQDILSDINTECDGSTIGLCLTQHWYEMEFVDYPNSRITRSSGWDLRWEDEGDVDEASVPRCRYFKIATLNKFSSSGSRNAWIVGHDCESDGGVRMITVTSDGVVSYASNTNPLSRPLYMWSSYDTSYDFKICTVFDVRMTQSGDCSSDLFSCRVSSLSFTQANVQRISATSTGAIGGTGGYSDIRFKKVMLDGN